MLIRVRRCRVCNAIVEAGVICGDCQEGTRKARQAKRCMERRDSGHGPRQEPHGHAERIARLAELAAKGESLSEVQS